MQRARKQCVVWGNSWARILGARVVVGGGRNASYQGESEEPVRRCSGLWSGLRSTVSVSGKK